MTPTTQSERTPPLLDAAKAKFGFVPNVLRQMSTSPAALEVYMQAQGSLANPGNRLSNRDRNLVQLAVSQHFGCDYCSAAHATIGKGLGSEPSTLDAVRAGQAIPEGEGGHMVEAVRLLLAGQGHLSGEERARLEGQGIDREVLYELIANISTKLLSNWVNHLAETEIDPQFG
jgi:AhpD family alkylhydroperoxidase